jgi:hypothetical protein
MSTDILQDFHQLTEIEIQVHLDTIKSDPEKFGSMGATSIMAIKRCREILESILKG